MDKLHGRHRLSKLTRKKKISITCKEVELVNLKTFQVDFMVNYINIRMHEQNSLIGFLNKENIPNSFEEFCIKLVSELCNNIARKL